MMSLRRGDEGLSTVARFQCVECAATYDLKVQSDKPINPEGYAKRAQQDGWKADPWKRNRCYCPRCAGPQKKMNDPNSELNKVVPLPVQPVPREITPEARQRSRAVRSSGRQAPSPRRAIPRHGLPLRERERDGQCLAAQALEAGLGVK